MSLKSISALDLSKSEYCRRAKATVEGPWPSRTVRVVPAFPLCFFLVTVSGLAPDISSFLVTLLTGKRLIPCRTQKLSPSRPMVVRKRESRTSPGITRPVRPKRAGLSFCAVARASPRQCAGRALPLDSTVARASCPCTIILPHTAAPARRRISYPASRAGSRCVDALVASCDPGPDSAETRNPKAETRNKPQCPNRE